VYWVIVTVRQQSAHSFSALHSMQGAGKGNLRSNDESTYGRCARRIRGSASSVKCCRTVTVTLYTVCRLLSNVMFRNWCMLYTLAMSPDSSSTKRYPWSYRRSAEEA
jgi:hypothetical protein